MEKGKKIRILDLLGLIVLLGSCLMSMQQMYGQNLVPNSSFEDYDDCPANYTENGQKIKLPYWYSPSKATPDYFNSCSRFNVGVPANIMGYQFAKDGQAYIGLVLAEHPEKNRYKSKQYREYLQTKLITPLKKDSTYIVSLNYCLAPYSTFAVNQLAVCLSGKKIKGKYKVIKPENILTGIDTAKIDTICGIWMAFSDTVVATGGENYLTIGNFRDDFNTRYQALDLSDVRRSLQETIRENGFAYYYIDMIEVRRYIP